MSAGPPAPQRPALSRELAFVSLVLLLCPVGALLAPDVAAEPLARAQAVVALERDLGLFPEPAMHAWLQERPLLLEAAGAFYVWVHVPVTIGLLVWLWLVRPHAYPLARRWLVATQALIVCGYVAFPMAPPRLLGGLGFRDTLTQLYGDGAAALAHSVQSPYAAMPSGHVAFAVLVAAGVAGACSSWRARSLAWAYPVVVTVIVMATANHLWLDAVGGVAAAAAGRGLALAGSPAVWGARLRARLARLPRPPQRRLPRPSERRPVQAPLGPIRTSAPFGSHAD